MSRFPSRRKRSSKGKGKLKRDDKIKKAQRANLQAGGFKRFEYIKSSQGFSLKGGLRKDKHRAKIKNIPTKETIDPEKYYLTLTNENGDLTRIKVSKFLFDKEVFKEEKTEMALSESSDTEGESFSFKNVKRKK